MVILQFNIPKVKIEIEPVIDWVIDVAIGPVFG